MESGDSVESESEVRLNKVDPQQAGSTITYLRRYTLQSLLSLEAIDDDAETAMNRKPKAHEKNPANENIDRAKLWLNIYDISAKDIKDKVRKYFGTDSVKTLNNEQMNKLEDMLKVYK